MAKSNLPNKKQLLQNIMTILESTEVAEPSLFFIQDGITVWLNREERKAYTAVLNLLLNFNQLTSKYSAKTITSGLKSLLVKFLTREEGIPSEKEVKEELDSWLTEMVMAKEEELTYFFVIENLKVHEELTIGKVKLEPLYEETVERLLGEIVGYLDTRPYYADKKETMESFKQMFEKDLRARFHPKETDTLMSITLLVRDVEREYETANELFQEVLRLLRFLGMFVYTRGDRAHIDLRGNLIRGITAYLALSKEGNYHFPSTRIGLLLPFDLTSERLKDFQDLGLDIFSGILSKRPSERTGVENRLMKSITWVSKSTSEPIEHDQFIQLCIAVETLLGGDEREGLTRMLSERLAFVLEDEKEKRLEIFKNAKKIFGIRGPLVHEGGPKDETEFLKYLPLLTEYACQAIVATTKLMNKHNLKTSEDFIGYLDGLKFA